MYLQITHCSHRSHFEHSIDSTQITQKERMMFEEILLTRENNTEKMYESKESPILSCL